MSSRPELRIAYCSHEAAKYAVEQWHYSRILPTGKLIKIGVWENDKFIGAVIYSRGASPHLGNKFSLKNTQICELTRVALTKHETPVSRVLAITMRMLKAQSEGLRLVVSFADPAQGHSGGIYKAGGWIFTGSSNEVVEYFIEGRWRHTRGAYWHPDRKNAPMRKAPGKLRYLFALDEAMRKQILPLSLPYLAREA
jgi:hypothetical protein